MLTNPALIGRYISFAFVATMANLGMQSIALLAVQGPYGLWVSVGSGTLMGFGVKYVLDKKFIFSERFSSPTTELVKLAYYGGTATLTTGIFWLSELGALGIWHTSFAKYLGGAVGLAVGYWAKYLLDRRFVFLGAV